MRAPTTLLLAAVLVAGGLLAYDALLPRDAYEAPRPTARDGVAPDVIAPDVIAPEAAAQEIDGALLVRLAALERRLEAQRRELAVLRARADSPSSVPDGSAQVATGFLAPPPRSPDGSPAIAQETLDTLRAYVAEAQRRMRADHARKLVVASLARLELSLHEVERARVLDAVLAYRAKARTFWSDMQQRGITDRPRQKAELQRMRDTFIAEIRPLVGDADLDRVIDGLIGRGSIAPGTPMRPRPWER